METFVAFFARNDDPHEAVERIAKGLAFGFISCSSYVLIQAGRN